MIISTGDVKPDLEITLSDEAGSPVNVAGLPVRIIGKRGGTLVFDRAPTSITVVGKTTVLTMLFEATDTANPGTIIPEVEVTWPGDKKQTFRTTDAIEVVRDSDFSG